ncbi:hypothetical protein ACIBF1_17140 [Spirillospora sp. NPDC050679]
MPPTDAQPPRIVPRPPRAAARRAAAGAGGDGANSSGGRGDKSSVIDESDDNGIDLTPIGLEPMARRALEKVVLR